MAAIESLLGILEMKKAQGLSLAAGEVPALLGAGGSKTPLTMPPLSASMLQGLLDEVLSAEQRQALAREGTLEAGYRSPGHGEFTVKARAAEGKTTLRLVKGTTRPPAPAPGPPRVAAASSAAAGYSTRAASSAPPTRPAPASDNGALARLLDEALARGASELILSSEAPPFVRVGGALTALPAPPVAAPALLCALTAAGSATLDTAGAVDFVVAHGDRRFRAHLFRHAGGEALTLRPLPAAIPTLAALAVPASLAALPQGLVLIAGPLASGKTTTLAALVAEVNRTRACHLVTVEDPLSYLQPRGRALVHQREVGTHTESIAAGLRDAVREGAEVIAVDELREADPAAIRLALAAAATRLVLATFAVASLATSAGDAPPLVVEALAAAFADAERPAIRQQIGAVLREVLVPGRKPPQG